MREELLEYYERELTYLRQMGAEFARKYPRVAGRLLLDPDSCEDPHVERLIESFAFLSARVHLRIDDDFPELNEGLLNLVFPGYLRPTPSMTIVEIQQDQGQGKKTAGARVPKDTVMVTKGTVDGLACRFRTSFDVELWPLTVTEAEWRRPEMMAWPAISSGATQAYSAARLRLKCFPDVTLAGLGLERLRFHLAGDASMVFNLYEMLSSRCVEIQLRDPADRSRVISLGRENLRMVGLEPEECVLPSDRRSQSGHVLLQEYFSFPEKFLFFDLSGLEALSASGFGTEAEILFLFSRFEKSERQQILELGVSARTFRLGCTPILNLFRQATEPILLSQARHDYRIIPDARNQSMMEIYSIDEVVAANPKLRQTVPLDPLYAYRFQIREEKNRAYWSASRKQNPLGEREPSAVYISVVDQNGRLAHPDADVLSIVTQCTNYELPSRLTFGNEAGDFDAVGQPAAKCVVALRRPTPSLDPPTGKGMMWRLISQLSLNYLSLTEGGRKALQEILRLHDFHGTVAGENQVGAITKLSASPHFAMVESPYGLVSARGTLVQIELDEQQFAGGGAYLFASVVDRFLAGYASMNSFVQLEVRTNQRKEVLGRWQPRAGTQVLL